MSCCVPEGVLEATDLMASPHLVTLGRDYLTKVLSPVGKSTASGGLDNKWNGILGTFC